MSIQSIAVNLFLRVFFKRGNSLQVLDYKKARALVKKNSAHTSRVPSDIVHTPIAADPSKGLCAAEWLSVKSPERIILYFHGGGYFFCDLETHRGACCYLTRHAKARLLSVDYRLAPEHPFPAAVHDALAWWEELLRQGISPKDVVFAGDSAGGGLALACMLAARDKNLPMPAAALLFSPWTDLTLSGETIKTKAKADVMFNASMMPQATKLYVNDDDASNPLISPLFADLTGLPDMLIFASEDEILSADSTRLHEKAKQAGVKSELILRKGLPHVWPIILIMPEAKQDMKRAAAFVTQAT